MSRTAAWAVPTAASSVPWIPARPWFTGCASSWSKRASMNQRDPLQLHRRPRNHGDAITLGITTPEHIRIVPCHPDAALTAVNSGSLPVDDTRRRPPRPVVNSLESARSLTGIKAAQDEACERERSRHAARHSSLKLGPARRARGRSLAGLSSTTIVGIRREVDADQGGRLHPARAVAA